MVRGHDSEDRFSGRLNRVEIWFFTLSAATMVGLYFLNLGLSDIWSDNEGRYADAVRVMLERHDYINFYSNGEPRLVKPPLIYWLMGLSAWLVGLNEFAIRLPSALLGLGAGWITFLIGRRLYGTRPAAIAAIATLVSLQSLMEARIGAPDMALTFTFALTVYFLLRAYDSGRRADILLMYVSLAMSVMMKGAQFIPPFLVFVLLYTFLRFGPDRRAWFSAIGRARLLPGLAAVLAIAALWYGYGFWRYGEQYVEIQRHELADRALAKGPNWFAATFYYVPVILWGFLPYSLVACFGAVAALRNRDAIKRHALPIAWLGSFLIVLFFVRGKLPHYILQAHPALGLLAAYYATQFVPRASWSCVLRAAVFPVSTVAVCAAAMVVVYAFHLPAWLYAALAFPIVLNVVPAVRVYLPLVSGLLAGFVGVGFVLPAIEPYRPWDEVGATVVEAVPNRDLPLYTPLGDFVTLPYYAERKVIHAPLDAILEAHPAVVFLRSEDVALFPGATDVWSGLFNPEGETKPVPRLMDVVNVRNGRESAFEDCSIIVTDRHPAPE